MIGSSKCAAVALMLVALGAAAQDFTCADFEPSRAQDPAYRRSETGPLRCEGFYERSVSQSFVELVSLTRGVPQAEGGSLLTLRAAARLPSRLVVQPLDAGPYYRVDAPLAADARFTWDAAGMLRATGLPLTRLGFIALARATPPIAVAPVSLGAAHDQSSKAFAVLRASVEVSTLDWRAYRPGAAASAWRSAEAPPYAWDPVALALALPSDGRALRIDVRATDADHKPLPMLSFIVVGPNDDKL